MKPGIPVLPILAVVIGLAAVVALIAYNTSNEQLCQGCTGHQPTTSSSNTSSSSTNPIASSAAQTVSNTSSPRTASEINRNGLEFMMSLSASSLDKNGSLTVSLNLVNTHDVNNTVDGYPTATNWRLTNQSEDGPINCAQNDPFRTELLQGYYDINNYTKGTPIDFTVWSLSGPNECLGFVTGLNGSSPPLFTFYSQNSYNFGPMTDRAQWVANGLQGADQPATMGEEVHIEPHLFTNSTGVFTVLSGDEWGDLQVLHFTIHS
jgi:hypothetical protein